MVHAVNLALTAALASLGLASALPPKIGNTVIDQSSGRMSVKVAPRNAKAQNAPLQMYKTYLKFKAPIPAGLQAAVANATANNNAIKAKRSTGSVAATPLNSQDDLYYEAVSIGTPAQTLNLDFDTGSADLWVFSSEMSKSDVNGQTVYNPSKSSTAKKMSGASWDISYGDGSSSSGDVYTDVVTVGGLTVKAQAVEAAKEVSDSFTQDSETDGLLGLSFSNLNTVSPKAQKTFFDMAIPSLDSPVFTADLKHNEVGSYNFGYIDSSAYTGSLTYVSVDTDPGYWTFTSSGYGIGSASFKSTKISGIADTGTTLLYLPDSVVSAYYKQVSGAKLDNSIGGYTYKCSTTLPSFTFGVGNAKITIPGNLMNYGPYTEGSSTCFGGLQSSDDLGINIFGDIALKAAFVVFDGSSSPRLGWASKKL